MILNLRNLREHAIGAVAVTAVASIATLLMGHMAKVGPPIFEYLTLGLGAITMIALGAAALMLAILIFKGSAQ